MAAFRRDEPESGEGRGGGKALKADELEARNDKKEESTREAVDSDEAMPSMPSMP